jgi:hypothetical protein
MGSGENVVSNVLAPSTPNITCVVFLIAPHPNPVRILRSVQNVSAGRGNCWRRRKILGNAERVPSPCRKLSIESECCVGKVRGERSHAARVTSKKLSCVKTDKDSGIVNDANDWAVETMHNPRYPLELLLRVITVSLETMKVVNALPALEIFEGNT